MRVAAVLSLMVVLAATVASGQDADRALSSPPFYIDRAARFAIMFPSPPAVANITYPTGAGAVYPARRFSVVDGANEYRVTVVDAAAGPAVDPRLVDKAVADLARQGKLIYQGDQAYEPGVASHQLMVSLGDGRQLQASVYMWDHRMHITEAKGAPGTPSLLRFAQSITLINADGTELNNEIRPAR